MKTILEQNKMKEADEILDFLSILTEEEKKEFKNFIDGVKFAKAYKNEDDLKTA